MHFKSHVKMYFKLILKMHVKMRKMHFQLYGIIRAIIEKFKFSIFEI